MPSDVSVPEPDVALILWAAHVEAHLSTLSPKKRLAYLRTMHVLFEQKTGPENVTPIRPRKHDAALRRSIAEAKAWYGACLPIFLERKE